MDELDKLIFTQATPSNMPEDQVLARNRTGDYYVGYLDIWSGTIVCIGSSVLNEITHFCLISDVETYFQKLK